MVKKLTTFERAEQSPTQWKKFLKESKLREKKENKSISQSLKKSAKMREKEIK